MNDPEVEGLVRTGEIDRAASMARSRGQWKRAAELFASVGRHAEAVLCAARGNDWRLAVDIALTSNDEQILHALAEEVGRDPSRAAQAAAQARLARRDDVAGMVLENTAPAEAAQCWYARGDYARAGRCWDRAGDVPQATRAFEQHLAQNPEDTVVATRLGELRAKQGDDEGAVRALQSAARAGAGAEVMKRLVCGLARVGYEQGAREWIRRLRDLDASHPAEVSAYGDVLPRSTGAGKRYAGRYRVVREVGSGATGRVLEAVDELTGDTVALKVLAVSDDRSAAFARFMREADLARSLDDPTLVRMRALDPEGPTIVYDWMPGGTLSARIGVMSLREVKVVALRLLGALEVLHRNGVVHRDVKPNNVLFDPAGQSRLGDLGAAHLGDLGATVTGGLVGSLPYMAPEQITGAPVSAATDLYAFGCVLFQMLTGVLPYAGPDYVGQHMGDPIPKPSEVRPGLSPTFDPVIEKLLAKDPDVRTQDVPAARALVMGANWDEPEGVAFATTPKMPSLPTGATDEGSRLVPSRDAPGCWTDQRLGRDILRVVVPIAWREAVERWAAIESTVLQPVYDLIDEDDVCVAWVEPCRTNARLTDVPVRARSPAMAHLRTMGLTEHEANEVAVAWNDDELTLVLGEVLRALRIPAEG